MATVLIGGGTGFIGKHLSRQLRAAGHEVRHLSRSKRPDSEYPTFQWDVAAQTIDDAALEGVEVVINLAGAGIVDKRWTDKRKEVIIKSRTGSTRLLAEAMSRMKVPPSHYLSASAIGFYGDRGNTLLTEESGPGNGFLSESVQRWEESVAAVEALGIPVFINRTGIVLHPREGALQKMLIPLNFRISGYFGDGSQYYSWIHVDDLVGAYVYAMEQHLTGTFNCVAPNPVTNKALAAALGPALGKSALVVPAPAFVMKLAMGEMSHTVLDSARCSAQKLEAAGYAFTFPVLAEALDDLLTDQ